jgi:putative transposase
MKAKRYTEEQIVQILKEGQSGTVTISELCRKHGISDASYYHWKAKYNGLEVSDLRRLRQLEDENRRLKHIVAEQTLDIQALKAVASKNW